MCDCLRERDLTERKTDKIVNDNSACMGLYYEAGVLGASYVPRD